MVTAFFQYRRLGRWLSPFAFYQGYTVFLRSERTTGFRASGKWPKFSDEERALRPMGGRFRTADVEEERREFGVTADVDLYSLKLNILFFTMFFSSVRGRYLHLLKKLGDYKYAKADLWGQVRLPRFLTRRRWETFAQYLDRSC